MSRDRSAPQPVGEASPPRPKRRGARPARVGVYLALIVLFALHNDLWLWDDPRFVLRLPVGLTYHVLYCVAAAVLMATVLRVTWPTPVVDRDGGARDDR
ncbi:MAG TPA: DUF3311 domain-containing protein [Candidatus Polarisedimenticolaceae bacterium]|nr:DUF3311 domain-containing protein [Candidatus Polarisedimenticolaceae bacterium]